MLLKCCTHYVSKFEKPSSGHRTEKGQSSFQFPRKAALKNIQTTGQLHSLPMLVRLCSKFVKLGFSSTWIKNFQMYKLGFKEAEDPEIRWPTFVGSCRKQGNSRKASTSASLTVLKPLTVWITTNWKILKEMGIPEHFTCPSRNLYVDQEATIRTLHGTTTDWFKIGKAVYCHPAYLTYM